MTKGATVGICVLAIGILFMVVGLSGARNAIDDEPQDNREHKNIIEYYENGTVKMEDRSISISLSGEEDRYGAWHIPGIGVNLYIFSIGAILTAIFGFLSMMWLRD